ncbi:DNA-binding MarR family transcriptional regulator [Kitasatospora sp. MAP12-15]|uniref:MarR family winged helix-turn-helix transcriptional regulator n=1 Tax=unclassified Kitasatospora TaxID=2633591 RepID=UPI002476419C|nr:MarR family transcriptional regulator [Kitasatospora sp. MAP12-44]MDH6109906.1 DNA-binding MarR family transcriptional regulator [Kitasatospora sp. MAP12-44]
MTQDAEPVDAQQLAAELRVSIGELVRHLRTEDELPQNQAGVLGLLVREGAHTTSELAERQRVRHQSMARTVALLVETGLVRQERHPSDGRKLVLTATEAGTQALLAQRRSREDRIAAAIERALTPQEQRTLREAVDLLRRLS